MIHQIFDTSPIWVPGSQFHLFELKIINVTENQSAELEILRVAHQISDLALIWVLVVSNPLSVLLTGLKSITRMFKVEKKIYFSDGIKCFV